MYSEFSNNNIERKIKNNIPLLNVFKDERFKLVYNGNFISFFCYIDKDLKSDFLMLVLDNLKSNKFLANHMVRSKIKNIKTIQDLFVLIASMNNKSVEILFSMDYEFVQFLPSKIFEIYNLLCKLLVEDKNKLNYLIKCLCIFLFTKSEGEIAQIKEEILKYQSKPINNKFVLF